MYKSRMSSRLLGIAFAVAALSFGAVAADLPSGATKGAMNPAVTQATIDKTICVSGWTKTVRPTVAYTNALKAKQIAAAQLPGVASDYEEDHLIPLEVGGAPMDERNLWPQHWNGPYGAHEKDKLENKLHKLVCKRQMTLKDAQSAFATDWVVSYKKYIGNVQ